MSDIMTKVPCARCGDAREWWCCEPANDGGAPWLTLGFYDYPRTAWRMRDGFVEVREADETENADGTIAISHHVVSLSISDIDAIAKAVPRG